MALTTIKLFRRQLAFFSKYEPLTKTKKDVIIATGLIDEAKNITYFQVYWVGPTLGAMVGAGLYKTLFWPPKDPESESKDGVPDQDVV